MAQKPRQFVLDSEDKQLLQQARQLEALTQHPAWPVYHNILKTIVQTRLLKNHESLPEGQGAMEFLATQQFNKGAVNGLTVALTIIDNTVTEAKSLAEKAGVKFDPTDEDENPDGDTDASSSKAP